MRFTFTEDQVLLQRAVRELLTKECPPAAVREAAELTGDWDRPRWDLLSGMGLVGLLAPPAAGGLGLSELDLVLPLEECGRACLPEPVVESAAVVVPLLAAAGDPRLAAVVDGSLLATVGLTTTVAGPYVCGAASADLLVLQYGNELHAVERPAAAGASVAASAAAGPSGAAVELTPVGSVDPTRRLSRVSWTPSAATRLDLPAGAADLAFERAALSTAAVLVGLAEHMVELAADYARERRQFGQPIGSFQAVKHLLADALLRIDFAKPVLYRAAWTVSRSDADTALRARDVSMAKAYASEAALRAARVALQVHGAIGYTWEHDLQFWMKKAWALAAAYGDAAWHRRRVGRWLLS